MRAGRQNIRISYDRFENGGRTPAEGGRKHRWTSKTIARHTKAHPDYRQPTNADFFSNV